MEVTKLDYEFDITEIQDWVDVILSAVNWHPHHNQIALNNNKPCDDWHKGTGSMTWDYDDKGNRYAYDPPLDHHEFIHLNSLVKGTILQHLYNTIGADYPVTRYRLMLLKHKKCMSYHTDPTPRIHIPVYTNPNARIVVNNNAYHLPADGSAYLVDTTESHTAFNADHAQDRIHLLIDL